MKRDSSAIDEIESLKEAKGIIKMITGNVYINGKVYQMMDDYIKKVYDELSDEEKKLFNKRYIAKNENESIIVENELSEYKKRLKSRISQHFSNPYCAKTDIGKVMYENEIIELIGEI